MHVEGWTFPPAPCSNGKQTSSFKTKLSASNAEASIVKCYTVWCLILSSSWTAVFPLQNTALTILSRGAGTLPLNKTDDDDDSDDVLSRCCSLIQQTLEAELASARQGRLQMESELRDMRQSSQAAALSQSVFTAPVMAESVVAVPGGASMTQSVMTEHGSLEDRVCELRKVSSFVIAHTYFRVVLQYFI